MTLLDDLTKESRKTSTSFSNCTVFTVYSQNKTKNVCLLLYNYHIEYTLNFFNFSFYPPNMENGFIFRSLCTHEGEKKKNRQPIVIHISDEFLSIFDEFSPLT